MLCSKKLLDMNTCNLIHLFASAFLIGSFSDFLLISQLYQSKKFYFLFQHMIIAIKFFLSCMIPDIPGWITKKMAKLQYEKARLNKVRNISIKSLVKTL